jgi:hypothetical protein
MDMDPSVNNWIHVSTLSDINDCKVRRMITRVSRKLGIGSLVYSIPILDFSEDDDRILSFGLSVVTEIVYFLGKYAIIELSTVDGGRHPLFWIPTDLLNIPSSHRKEAARAEELFSVVLTPT